MNDRADPALILASGSPYRAEMLRNAGIEFAVEPARLDERSVEQPLLQSGADPADIAVVLAQAKADEVSGRFASATIIGSDQTLELAGELLHKPADMEAARRRLLALSGRTHQLHTAICLMRAGEVIWSHLETSHIRFRELNPGFIGRHLARVGDKALTSVGGYQVEGEGAQLIESIEGDFFSIVGLPLLPLIGQLRALGLLDH